MLTVVDAESEVVLTVVVVIAVVVVVTVVVVITLVVVVTVVVASIAPRPHSAPLEPGGHTQTAP